MARAIDADALIAWIKGSQQMTSKMKCVIAKIETMPDAVSVVRCKECKHEPICSHSVQHTTHEPTSVTIGCKSVGFCSYGERKDQ